MAIRKTNTLPNREPIICHNVQWFQRCSLCKGYVDTFFVEPFKQYDICSYCMPFVLKNDCIGVGELPLLMMSDNSVTRLYAKRSYERQTGQVSDMRDDDDF